VYDSFIKQKSAKLNRFPLLKVFREPSTQEIELSPRYTREHSTFFLSTIFKTAKFFNSKIKLNAFLYQFEFFMSYYKFFVTNSGAKIEIILQKTYSQLFFLQKRYVFLLSRHFHVIFSIESNLVKDFGHFCNRQVINPFINPLN